MLLPIHIAAGGLAILLGALALLVKKGGSIHRRSGLVFVYAMAVMGITASILGFLKSPTDGNVIGGILPLYFVSTALTTVRPASRAATRINIAALVFALAFTVITYMRGFEAFHSPRRVLNGVPFPMFFFLATITLLAAFGDLRIFRSSTLHGGRRLARHLWRMCFALFIAAGSFFSIRHRVAKVLPEPFTTAPMRALPIVLVFVAMFYWLWRVRGRRALPVLTRHDAAAVATLAK
ncbi:MAG: DUF2306 domain-containing protein [Acidobacteriota bacterium]|nr:DUF2306 domain-containing protein [Acidobacteriota bacterium]